MFGFLSALSQTLITLPWKILPLPLYVTEIGVWPDHGDNFAQGIYSTKASYRRPPRQLGFAGSPSSGQGTQPSLGTSLACRAHRAAMRPLRPISHPDPLIAPLLPPRNCPEHPAMVFWSPVPVPLLVSPCCPWAGWRWRGADWADWGAGGWGAAHASVSNSVAPTKNV